MTIMFYWTTVLLSNVSQSAFTIYINLNILKVYQLMETIWLILILQIHSWIPFDFLIILRINYDKTSGRLYPKQVHDNCTQWHFTTHNINHVCNMLCDLKNLNSFILVKTLSNLGYSVQPQDCPRNHGKEWVMALEVEMILMAGDYGR